MNENYLSPEELEEMRDRYPLTDKGRVWLDEIERRFTEGQTIEQIAADLDIEPWCIQLLCLLAD